jgi:hypothetical protein
MATGSFNGFYITQAGLVTSPSLSSGASSSASTGFPAQTTVTSPMRRLNVPGLVEYYPAVAASQMAHGLGFNAQSTANLEWVVKLAGEAGASTLRWQPSWEAVEDMNGNFTLPAFHTDALTYCKKYGIQPILVAAYGPPRTQQSVVTVASNVAQGAYTITVRENISAVTPLYCFIQWQNGWEVTDYHAYYGSLIDAVNANTKTITLAAKTRMAIPAGTKLVINRLKYAPIFSTNPNDPSVVAYCRYVRYLASAITQYGLNGQVELWNEPVWDNDRWDAGPLFYDRTTSVNYNPNGVDVNDLSPRHKAILYNLMNGPAMPDGVSLNNGATHKTGFATLLQWIPQPAQIKSKVETESFHPYGINPEDFAWYSDVHPYVAPLGITEGANVKWYFEELNALQETGAVVPYASVTETGVSTTNDIVQARFVMRQYLLMHSLGFRFVDFYALAENNPNFWFVNPATQAPRAAYNSIKDFVANRLNAIDGNAIAHATAFLPKIVSYSGTWPLAVVPVMGEGSAMLLCAWQRTYVNTQAGGDFANNPPQANPVQLTIELPDGSSVVAAWDTVTLQNVSFTQSGNRVNYPVTDNPVALQVELAVTTMPMPVQVVTTFDPLPTNAALFPLRSDSRSVDRKFALYDMSTTDDQHLKRNRFTFDPVIGRYVQILPSKAYRLTGFDKGNWGWGAWAYIPDGLGNEVYKYLYVTSSPLSFWGSLLILGTRTGKMYGVNDTGGAVEVGTLNGVSTYPFRGKWRYVFCSWGPAGTKLYIDGQLYAMSTAAKATDMFNEPAINGNTTDNVFMRDMAFIPYQPTDAEVLRWSSPNHSWTAAPTTGIEHTFVIPGTVSAQTFPQIWNSPYFFTIKNVSVAMNTASAVTLNLLRNGIVALTMVVPAGGSVELTSQAVTVNRGDRLALQLLSSGSAADLNVTISGD